LATDAATIGDAFAKARKPAILIVPSALGLELVHQPLHAEFAKIRVHCPEPVQYDARFFE